MKRIIAIVLVVMVTGPVLPQANTTSLGILPAEVSETSGLLFYNNALITHNDSGNEAALYVLDTLSLEVTRTVVITNAFNTDWEDLAADDTYIYIGDFGNNQGMRTDLGIYRIAKQDFDNSDEVSAELIAFIYEDQTDFSGGANSDWDAEALIALGDSLIIFTKQWQSNGTVAYSIPKTPGSHSATRLESYPSNGLITGATYNPESEVVFLNGYSQQLLPFVIRISGIQALFSFNATTMRTSLPLSFTQMEAIAHSDVNTYYLSSERFVNASPPITLEQQLFRFTTEDMTGDPPPEDPPPSDPPPEDPPEDPEPALNDNDVVLFQRQGSDRLSYVIGQERTLYGRALFDITGRRIYYTPASEIQDNSIDIATLRSAIYYLSFYFDGKLVSKAFYRR